MQPAPFAHDRVDMRRRHSPSKRSKGQDAALFARHEPDAAICRSEVARAIALGWRGALLAVHAATNNLVRDGLVRLSWTERPLATRSGPYRIGRFGDG
jgi:hypothetical protein